MNREVFIDELRKELSKLPEEEVEAAVEYYEEYFDEAGEDNEDNVIKSSGKSKKGGRADKIRICGETSRRRRYTGC